eukprot:scaffold7089_cov39-Phaeocystis_antarctica.AAC.1
MPLMSTLEGSKNGVSKFNGLSNATAPGNLFWLMRLPFVNLRGAIAPQPEPLSVVPSEQLRLQPTWLGNDPPEQTIAEEIVGDGGGGGEGGEGDGGGGGGDGGDGSVAAG